MPKADLVRGFWWMPFWTWPQGHPMPSIQMSVDEHVEQAPVCNTLRPSTSITFECGIYHLRTGRKHLVPCAANFSDCKRHECIIKLRGVKIGKVQPSVRAWRGSACLGILCCFISGLWDAEDGTGPEEHLEWKARARARGDKSHVCQHAFKGATHLCSKSKSARLDGISSAQHM